MTLALQHPVTTKLYSALEPASIVVALLVSVSVLVFYKDHHTQKVYISVIAGFVAAIMMLFLTHYTFELSDERVLYGTLFWSRTIPIANIQGVSSARSLGIVPGTVIIFRLRPLEIEGRVTGRGEHVSVGRWLLPDAKRWLDQVNAYAARQ